MNRGLWDHDLLVKRTITLTDAMQGKWRDIAAASYAWEAASDPDPKCERLHQHARVLEENPDGSSWTKAKKTIE